MAKTPPFDAAKDGRLPRTCHQTHDQQRGCRELQHIKPL